MKSINIWFTDLNYELKTQDSIIYKWLASKYRLNLTRENPDFVVSSVFGDEHLKYDNAVKILISGENVSPDFNLFDYAVTSDPISFGDRHLRVPYWALRNLSSETFETSRRPIKNRIGLTNRKFCNFVYSNSSNYCAMPNRNELFRVISKLKHVDSGGSCLNNMGGLKVADKMAFIAEYKFTIACENSIKAGYSTEKILEPLIANSIPIYYGDPEISKEFNPKAFVNVADYDSEDALLNRILELDSDDKKYLDMLYEPIFINGHNLISSHLSALQQFLTHIFDQSPDEAKRRCKYGWTKITVDTHIGMYRPIGERIKSAVANRLPYLSRFFYRK